jgi:hypothetical protein
VKILSILLFFLFISCGQNSSSDIVGIIPPDINENYENLTVSKITLPKDGTYGEGSSLIFQVEYENLLNINGSPQLKLNVNDNIVYADLISIKEGSNILEFEYIITASDQDTDGIVLYKDIVLNEATVEDENLNYIDTSLAKDNILLSNILIDLTRSPPSKISSINTAPSSESGVLNLTWNVPLSDNPIINYYVQYRKKGTYNWINTEINPEFNNLKLSDLEYNTDYEIRISANNGVLGEYSDIKEVFIFDLMDLNPIAWLDATDPNGDGTLPVDGSLISRWVDKTGKATDATETNDSRKPHIVYDVINGLPSIRFDQLAQGLEGGFVRENNGGLTVFLVAKMDKNSVRKCFFEFYQEGSPNSGADSRRGFFFNYGFNEASQNFFLDDNNFNLWTAYDDGHNTSMWENGTNVFKNNPNHFGSTEFIGNGIYILGDDKTGGDAIGGYISEFLIFDRELNSEEVTIIEEYLTNKWGLN